MTKPKAAAKKAPAKKPAAKRAATKKKPPRPSERLDMHGIDAVCAKIADGKSMTEIAKGLKLSFGTLSTWVESDPERSARAREARSQAARLWDEKAEAELRAAGDAFELAKAKELGHHYRWRAAKIAPRDYGDKMAVGQDPDLEPLTVVVKKYSEA